jgi:D-aminoacyl-tRNA deacylase
MITVVASSKDLASMNIRNYIVNSFQFRKSNEEYQGNRVYLTEVRDKVVRLLTINSEHVFAQSIAELQPASKLIVFVSRHSSKSGTPTFSVHTPGNLGKAEMGGQPRKVSISPANAMKDVLKIMMKLKEEIHLDYDVCYEGTHHGPSLEAPSMFVELGSSPKQWRDVKAAKVVGEATMGAIANFGNFSSTVVIGIGGPHYNKKFTRIAFENNLAFSHIIPKYALPYVDADLIIQCLEKTLERVDTIILDWKGIKAKDKPKLIKILEEIGVKVEKIKH